MNKLAILVVLLSLAAAAQTAKPLSELEQTLINHAEAVHQAQKAKNADFLKRTLTEDFRAVGSEGRLHDKEEFVGDAADGTLKDYTVYNPRVLPVDDTSAIVTYDAVIQAPEGDFDVAPRYQHFSDLWVKQADQWKLRFQQATPRRAID
jgi:hypothetical protein